MRAQIDSAGVLHVSSENAAEFSQLEKFMVDGWKLGFIGYSSSRTFTSTGEMIDVRISVDDGRV